MSFFRVIDQLFKAGLHFGKKAQGATTQTEKLEQKMKLAKLKGKGNKFSAKLTKAHKNEAIVQKLARDIRILLFWLRNDILSLAGAEWSERMELMHFIIEELQLREDQAHKGIKALRTALSNQKEDLLAFAEVLDQKLGDIAHQFHISLSQVQQVCLLMKKSLSTNVYWQKWNQVCVVILLSCMLSPSLA